MKKEKKYYNMSTIMLTNFITVFSIIVSVFLLLVCYDDKESLYALNVLFGFFIVLLMWFWATSRLNYVVLLEDRFMVKKYFSEEFFLYSDIKAVCIVRERVAVSHYGGYKDNKKYDIRWNHGKIKVSVEYVYHMGFLTQALESNSSSLILQNQNAVKKHFGTNCVSTVSYGAELLEDVLNHGMLPIYMKNDTLKDIDRDIKKLGLDSSITVKNTIEDVVILDCKS
jgi:hypothetical protein